MNGHAALLALALVQSPEAQPAPPPVPEAPPAAAEPIPAPQRPPAQLAPSPPAPETEPAPAPPPPEPEQETKPSQTAPPPAPAPRKRRPPPASAPEPTPGPPPAATTGTSPPAAETGPAAPPASRPPAAPAPAPKEAKSSERMQVAAAATRFFQALLARRPADLAALCAPTFSFDGKVLSGADAIRGRWADLVAGHGGATYALLDLEILASSDAQARYGKPPKRLAALAAPGSWIALANLSGRATFVFYTRQGNAWLATGIHD